MAGHVEALAPCTVGNFGPGFDVFSLALARRGDLVRLAHAAEDSVHVTGPGAARIPRAWDRNAACAALDELRKRTGRTGALRVEIAKGAPPGSGLGSSASSSAAAVRAFARLHGVRIGVETALQAAGAGEAAATGSAHFDDVAAALYGGLTIVGGEGPDAVVRLRPPPLSLVVALPRAELPTREMRALIPDALPRKDVVHNLSCVARVVAACARGDAAMLCRALDDRISKPYRSPRVPLFERAEEAARAAGAHAFVLCGSGPAVLAAMPEGVDPAPVADALRSAYGDDAEVFATRPHEEVDDPAVPLP